MATVWERLRTRARAMLPHGGASAKWVQPSNTVTRSIYDPIEAVLSAPLEESPRPVVAPPAEPATARPAFEREAAVAHVPEPQAAQEATGPEPSAPAPSASEPQAPVVGEGPGPDSAEPAEHADEAAPGRAA